MSKFKKKRLKHREKSFVNWNPNYQSQKLKLNKKIRIISNESNKMPKKLMKRLKHWRISLQLYWKIFVAFSQLIEYIAGQK